MDKFKELFYELEGVITDVEQGDGFDDVCLGTIKRVQSEIAELRRANLAVSTEWTDEEIDLCLDKILKASGSARKHFSMQKTIDDMRAAMRDVLKGKP